MEKKIYIAPLSEVMHLEPNVVMKGLVGASNLPGQMGGAPKRRNPDVF